MKYSDDCRDGQQGNEEPADSIDVRPQAYDLDVSMAMRKGITPVRDQGPFLSHAGSSSSRAYRFHICIGERSPGAHPVAPLPAADRGKAHAGDHAQRNKVAYQGIEPSRYHKDNEKCPEYGSAS